MSSTSIPLVLLLVGAVAQATDGGGRVTTTLSRGREARFVDGPPPDAGSATTVVYVCDASGSMINAIAAVKAELTKSISGLKAIHRFNIIFFRDEKCVAFGKGLQFATPKNKGEAIRWMETVTPTGTTNPVPSLEVAFACKPKVIYLLTDGDFPDNDAVKAAIDRLNKDKGTRLHPVLFGGGKDASRSFIDLMKQVARENGGAYKHVKSEEVDDSAGAAKD